MGPHAAMWSIFIEAVVEDGCRAAAFAEIAQRAGDCDASLTFCGHTHIPRAVGLDDGGLIVNPRFAVFPTTTQALVAKQVFVPVADARERIDAIGFRNGATAGDERQTDGGT